MSSTGPRSRGRPSQPTIDRVTLPDSVKCLICNKNRLLLRYSNNQLTKYKENIYYKSALKAERPRCVNCTAGPSSELQCVDCKQYKSLDDFSKNARSKDRDNAHCWQCQQKVSDQEANVEDAMKEAEIEEEYHRRGTAVSYKLYPSVNQVSDFQNFNMSSMGSSLPSGSNKSSQGAPSEAGTDDTGCVLIQQPLSPGVRATTSRGRTQANGSNENSRHRSESQDTAETSTTDKTTRTATSKVTSRGFEDDMPSRAPRNGMSQGTASDKWHKQGAVKKTAEEKARATVERSTQGPMHQQRPKDDDEDSDSEFEM